MFLDDVAVLINTGFEKSYLIAERIVKRASINAGAVKKLLNRTGLVPFFPKLLHCAGEVLRLIENTLKPDNLSCLRETSDSMPETAQTLRDFLASLRADL